MLTGKSRLIKAIPVISACLFLFLSCSLEEKITNVKFDQTRRLYTVDNFGQKRIFLRDDNHNLIRTEQEKDRFVSNYNKYLLLDEKLRTNEYYNNYFKANADSEKYILQDTGTDY